MVRAGTDGSRTIARARGTMLPAGTGLPAAAVPPVGAVAIAAITSCTNTSDPRLAAAAGFKPNERPSLQCNRRQPQAADRRCWCSS